MMKRTAVILLFVFVSCAVLILGYSSSPYSRVVGEQAKYEAKAYVYNAEQAKEAEAAKNKPINDPLLNSQWAIGFTQSDKAWEFVTPLKEVKVAVVDSGVDYNHPDLKNRILFNLGRNFVSNNNNAMDDMGHGTEVAGIIAAQAANGIGVSGIAGPLDVKIIPVKVLDKSGKGPSDVIAKGIKYAADAGADVINVSIDFDTHDSYIINALKYARNRGVLVVVASGNSNSNCDLYSPAGDNESYTVAAIMPNSEKAPFSSYGSSVSLAAPGVNILTTQLGGGYINASGTSMAAPIVSGIAAMMKAENPYLTVDDMTKILDLTATDIFSKGKDKESGYGIVNAYDAVVKAGELEKQNNVLLGKR